MSTYRLMLTGIVAEGRHGANPGEQLEPQEFLIDLDITVNVDADTLDATLDYRVAADAARDAVGGASHVLLESLAEAVAREIYQFEPVSQVVAVVHKPAAAESLGLDDIAAEAIVGP
jgi:dihydroneopterin aldolase